MKMWRKINVATAGRAVCPHTAGFVGRRGNVIVRLATSMASSTELGCESGRLGQPSLPVELSLRSYRKHFTFSIFHFTFVMLRAEAKAAVATFNRDMTDGDFELLAMTLADIGFRLEDALAKA